MTSTAVATTRNKQTPQMPVGFKGFRGYEPDEARKMEALLAARLGVAVEEEVSVDGCYGLGKPPRFKSAKDRQRFIRSRDTRKAIGDAARALEYFTRKDLEEETRFSRSTISKIAARLEKCGWISKHSEVGKRVYYRFNDQG